MSHPIDNLLEIKGERNETIGNLLVKLFFSMFLRKLFELNDEKTNKIIIKFLEILEKSRLIFPQFPSNNNWKSCEFVDKPHSFEQIFIFPPKNLFKINKEKASSESQNPPEDFIETIPEKSKEIFITNELEHFIPQKKSKFSFQKPLFSL